MPSRMLRASLCRCGEAALSGGRPWARRRCALIAEDDVEGLAAVCVSATDRVRNFSASGYLDAAVRARPNLTIRGECEVASSP